jgi:hypothetical protein
MSVNEAVLDEKLTVLESARCFPIRNLYPYRRQHEHILIETDVTFATSRIAGFLFERA